MGRGKLGSWFLLFSAREQLNARSGIENVNRIFLSEAKETVDDSKIMGMSYREMDIVVIEDMCDLIRDE